MNNGTIEDAVKLAQQRWAQLNEFDLEGSTWVALFQQYSPGEILQAIKLTKDTRDSRPEKRYERFAQLLQRVSARNQYIQ